MPQDPGDPTVTIGIPVYNGAADLDDCLTCLRDQTLRRLEVLIYDNHSTDATAEIAKAASQADPRFHYVQQPTNKGPLPNFIDALKAARTPYFAWRAHDDLSDRNYFEVLAGLLDAHPKAMLAVGQVESRKRKDGSVRVRHIPYRLGRFGPRVARWAWNLHASHQCWFYGLWRRDALIDMVERIWPAYPHGWAGDHLTLMPALLADGVVGTNVTRFIQRLERVNEKDATQKVGPTAAVMREMRDRFIAICHQELAGCHLSGWERRAMAVVIDQYAGRRVVSRSRLRRLARRNPA